MTFEEFFIKKRIDLAQLQVAEPELFLEFKSHFALMGEKSFDQVKKFWFNKLRRAYHLKEVPKPAKETLIKEQIASQAESLSSLTLDQKPEGFPGSKPVAPNIAEAAGRTEAPEKSASKPKFTPRNIPSKPIEAELPQEEVTKEDASKPATSYKPRFNPKNIKPKEESGAPVPASAPEKNSDNKGSEPSTPAAAETGESEKKTLKPAFKPRFNMKNIKPKEEPGGEDSTASPETEKASEVKESTTSETASESKPAYKPRFKMKNIQPKEESGISIPASAPEANPVESSHQNIEGESKTPIDNLATTGESESDKTEAKPAYKPRFKMKNIQPKEESGISIPASASEKSEEEKPSASNQEDEQVQANPVTQQDDEQSQKTETKPAYKPRFNIKNIKPKSEE